MNLNEVSENVCIFLQFVHKNVSICISNYLNKRLEPISHSGSGSDFCIIQCGLALDFSSK